MKPLVLRGLRPTTGSLCAPIRRVQFPGFVRQGPSRLCPVRSEGNSHNGETPTYDSPLASIAQQSLDPDPTAPPRDSATDVGADHTVQMLNSQEEQEVFTTESGIVEPVSEDEAEVCVSMFACTYPCSAHAAMRACEGTLRAGHSTEQTMQHVFRALCGKGSSMARCRYMKSKAESTGIGQAAFAAQTPASCTTFNQR